MQQWCDQEHGNAGRSCFWLMGKETVEQALAEYKAIDLLPERRWAGSRKDSIKYCTAFGRFRDGLLRELVQHANDMGEMRALAELEQERLATMASARHSQLRRLANKYYKAWKLAKQR